MNDVIEDLGDGGENTVGPRIPMGLRRYAVNLMIRQGFAYSNTCDTGIRMVYPMLRARMIEGHLSFTWDIEEMRISANLHPQELEYFRERISWNPLAGYGETGHRATRLNSTPEYDVFTDRNEDGWTHGSRSLESSFERVRNFDSAVSRSKDRVRLRAQDWEVPRIFRTHGGDDIQGGIDSLHGAE